MSTHVDRPCVGDEETYLRAVFGKHWDDVPRAQQDVLCDEMSEKMVEWFDSWPPDIYNLAFPKEE